MKRTLIKTNRLARRRRGIRKRIEGTPECPRLAVSRSSRNIYAQVIDDFAGRTLCAAGTQMKDVRTALAHGGNAKAAAEIGKLIGEKAKALGIEQVRFDRRGYRYHGRIKALADAAREAGLKF